MIMESYLTSIFLILLGLGCIVFKKNLIKKIIGLGVFNNGIHLFLITMGYRYNSIPPILSPENINSFSLQAVDPLPQALVLTSIVINLSITALGLMISAWTYKRFNTLDTDLIKNLRG